MASESHQSNIPGSEISEKIFPQGSREDGETIRKRLRTFKTLETESCFQLSLNDGSFCIRVGSLSKVSTKDYKRNVLDRLDIAESADKFTLYPVKDRKNRPFNFSRFHNTGVLVLNDYDITDVSFGDGEGLDYEGMLGWKMQVFSLEGASISDAIVPKLVAMLTKSRDSIRIINLKNTLISDRGLSLIQKEFPHAVLNPESDLFEYYIFETCLSGTCLVFNEALSIDDESVKQLNALPITHLSLQGTLITSKAYDTIATLQELRDLNLCRTSITDENFEKLLSLPSLHRLNLCETNITSHGIAKLAASKSLTHLLLGPLYSGKLYPSIGPEAFSRFSPEHPLEYLSISSKKLEDKALSDIAHLKNLYYLDIMNSKKITDVGLMRLAKAKSLKVLGLTNTGVTTIGIEKFKNSREDVILLLYPVACSGVLNDSANVEIRAGIGTKNQKRKNKNHKRRFRQSVKSP